MQTPPCRTPRAAHPQPPCPADIWEIIRTAAPAEGTSAEWVLDYLHADMERRS